MSAFVRLESLSGHVRKHDGLLPRELIVRGLRPLIHRNNRTGPAVPCQANFIRVGT